MAARCFNNNWGYCSYSFSKAAKHVSAENKGAVAHKEHSAKKKKLIIVFLSVMFKVDWIYITTFISHTMWGHNWAEADFQSSAVEGGKAFPLS